MLRWFFSEALFRYLRTRSIGKKLTDAALMMTLVTWVAMAYLFASNFTAASNFANRVLNTHERIEVRAAVIMNERIDEELRALMQSTDADRAALARFHNGRTDTQGIHFVYSSRSNEIVQPGVSKTVNQRQSVLLSIIHVWMVRFIDNKCIAFTSMKPADSYYEFFRETGVKSAMACPVTSVSGDPIAFVTIEYTTSILTETELAEKEDAMRMEALRIAGILTLRLTEK